MTDHEIPVEEWASVTSIGMASASADTDVVADLDRFLTDGDEPDYESEPVPAESLDQANRWLRSIARLDREADRVRDAADTEIERVEAWKVERLAPIQKQREWLARSCEMLAAALYERDPKTVSHHVPNGRIYSRHQAPEWTYTDEGSFIAWAEVHRPDLLNTPEPVTKPDRNAVKKAFGDVIPKRPTPGDEIPVTTHDGAGTVVPVPGLRVVIRERDWKFETT